jgi:hypothetical protein
MKPMSSGRNVADITVAAKRLVDRMLDRWSNHKKTPAQLKEYRADIVTLMQRRGIDAVEKAVQEARLCRSFFPELGELWELLPPIPESAKPKFPEPDPDCGDCSGSGWKIVELPSATRPGQTEKRAQRCPCKAPITPRPAPVPTPEQHARIVQESVKVPTKVMDPAPAAKTVQTSQPMAARAQEKLDAARRARWQRTEADKETRREATLQDSALRDIGIELPMPPAESGEDPEPETAEIVN